MYEVIYSAKAREDLHEMEKSIAQRIIRKIFFYSQQKDILSFAKPLHLIAEKKYRFRVGDYRIIFSLRARSQEIQILMILRIKHRKDIYDL